MVDPATRDLRTYVGGTLFVLAILVGTLGLIGLRMQHKDHPKRIINYANECAERGCTTGISNGCYVWSDNTVQCQREP